MGRELRRSPRFPFVAVAELSHAESGEKLASTVAELSLNGCYVDMLNTFPVGSVVTIKIFVESDCFKATAKAYIHIQIWVWNGFSGSLHKKRGTSARLAS